MKTRGLDVDQRTPVESRRDERGGVHIDVTVPVLQSATVAAIAALLLVALVILVHDAGELAFWTGSGIISLSAFLWTIACQYDGGVTPLDLVSAFLMSMLGGFFCWAFARVATWANADFVQMCKLSAFVFLLVFYAHIQMTLLQRLAQPWQFQRKAIWETFKTLAEYWGKRTQPRQPPPPGPIANTGSRTVISRDHPDPDVYVPPAQLTEIEMFLELSRDYGTLARDDGKDTHGLMGKIKSNGEPLTKTEWDAGKAWLLEYGYTEHGNGGWAVGASAEIALDSIVR